MLSPIKTGSDGREPFKITPLLIFAYETSSDISMTPYFRKDFFDKTNPETIGDPSILYNERAKVFTSLMSKEKRFRTFQAGP